MAEDRPELANQYALEQLSRQAEKDPEKKKAYLEAMADPQHLPPQPGYQPLEPLDPEKPQESQETLKENWLIRAANAVKGMIKKGPPPATGGQEPTLIRQAPASQPPAKAA